MKALDEIRQKLHMTMKTGDVFTYCGKRISQTPTAIFVDQWAAATAVEPISLRKERAKQGEDPLTHLGHWPGPPFQIAFFLTLLQNTY